MLSVFTTSIPVEPYFLSIAQLVAKNFPMVAIEIEALGQQHQCLLASCQRKQTDTALVVVQII